MTKRTPKAPRWCRRRAASLFLAFVQMPLDAAAVAALRAEFASEHGGVTLIPDVQAALVSELAGSGEDLASCGLDVTWDDVQSWESVWATTLADAGRAKGRDKARFVQWAKARTPDPVKVAAEAAAALLAGTSSAETSDTVGRLIRRLEKGGTLIPDAAKAEMRKEFEDSRAGDYKRQCCCAKAVWIIYLGRMPTDAEVAWWDREFQLSGGSSGGKIDITRADGYIKMHSKTMDGDVLTLSRALKHEAKFREWAVTTMDSLSHADLPLAAVQLTKVLTQAEQQSYGVWAVKSSYIHNYFFVEYLGVGLPEVTAINSAIKSMGLGIQLAGGRALPTQLKLTSGSDAGSVAGSATGRTELYSNLPGSASEAGGSTATSIAVAVKEALRDMLPALAERPNAEEAKPVASLTTKSGACAFCGRAACGLVKPGAPACRESRRALDLLRTEKKVKDKAAEEAEA